MPTIPVYNDSVAPASVPDARLGVQATPAAFGSGIAQGASNLADVSLDIHQQERRKADQVRMLDLDRQLGEWENAKLYDPNTGAFTKRGKDAFDLPQTVMDDYDQFAGTLQQGLTSDQQRIAAQQLIDGRRMAVERSVQGHVAGQISSFEETAFKGVMDTSRNAALANYQDAERVAAEAERQRTAVAGYARRNGLPDTWVEDTAGKAQSATYAGAISRMLEAGDDRAAKAAYDRWSANLTGDDAGKLDRALEASSTAGEAQRIADQIVLAKDGSVDQRGAIDDRIRSDDRLQGDVKLRDQVQSRVDQFLHQQAQAKDEADRAGFLDAWKMATDPANPLGINDPRVQAKMANLTPERQVQLASYAKRDTPRFSQDLYDLRRMVGTQAFEHVDLTKYIGKVPGSELDALAQTQQEQRDKGLNGPKVQEQVGDAKIVDNALHNLSLDSGGQQRSDTALDFEQRYKASVAQAIAASGNKTVGDTDRRAIANVLAKDYVVTVQRAAYSPLRLIAGPTSSDDLGPLYKQPTDVVQRQLPITGTVSERTGEGLSADDLLGWVKAVNAPDASPTSATAQHLDRMRRGIASDGSYDAALIQRYELIKAAAREAKAHAKTAGSP